MTNQEILDKLNSKVHGHLEAKKALINLINRSKRRYLQHYKELLPLEDCLPTSNCLLIGDSGTGKTLLVESLQKIMDFSMITFDASCFNPVANKEGLNAKSVSKAINDHINSIYEQDCSKKIGQREYLSWHGVMHQTIVYIDEFDKMCSEYNNSDWKQGTQSEFLTLFENKGEFEGLTFIFSGAFAKLEKKTKKTSIGFNQDSSTIDDHNLDEALINYGVLPELLGRIGRVVSLDQLTKDDYMEILRSKLLPSMEKDLKVFGIDNYYMPYEKQLELVSKAVASKLGVRGLKKEIAAIMSDLEFDANSNYNADFSMGI